MDETTASRLITDAKARQKNAPGLESYFWGAYIHGVRRAWHGEGFDEERHQLLGVPENEIFDDARLMQVRGYKAGLAGERPDTLAERMKKWMVKEGAGKSCRIFCMVKSLQFIFPAVSLIRLNTPQPWLVCRAGSGYGNRSGGYWRRRQKDENCIL